MSPDHQVDEQLNLAVLSTFQLILKAFLDCVIPYHSIDLYIVQKRAAQNVVDAACQLGKCAEMALQSISTSTFYIAQGSGSLERK